MAEDDNYHGIKMRIMDRLSEWSDLIAFDDLNHSISYETEAPLIPQDNSKTPVLILLSNPHPHSVKQGMYLSPNRSGRENPFWQTLRESGYFDHDDAVDQDVMVENNYRSPFRFFMAVLLSFPSEDPSHLKDIFGIYEYEKMLWEGREDLKELLIQNDIRHVVCFGKLQYDTVSTEKTPGQYTSILGQGGMISSRCTFCDDVVVYLTYPTGWRFVRDHRILKSGRLRNIFEGIARSSIR
jgi:hypothetical protein